MPLFHVVDKRTIKSEIYSGSSMYSSIATFFLMRKMRNLVASTRGKVFVLAIFCFANICLLYTISTWIQNVNYVNAQASRLKRREETLAEVVQYNKDNVQNEIQHFPKVIGIGVKKCGTDGIIRFLDHHPSVRIPGGVESFFFNSGSRNFDQYRKSMPKTNDRQIAMEKTPIYFGCPPANIPQLMKEAIPDVKVVLIVCDPTKRAFSDYVHERERFRLFNDQLMAKYNTFDDYVNENLPLLQKKLDEWASQNISYENGNLREKFVQLMRTDVKLTMLSNGIYTAHIDSWKKAFNESSLKIIEGKQFLRDPGPIVEELQDFIGLPKVLLQEDFVKRPDTGFYCYRQFTMEHFYNATKRNDVKAFKCLEDTKGRTRNERKTASEETMERLRKFFHPFNQKFYRDVGVNYGWQ